MLPIQKFGKHGVYEELAHLSSITWYTGRTTRRLVNVLVRLLNMFAHMISKGTDMLKVIMNTEMSIINCLSTNEVWGSRNRLKEHKINDLFSRILRRRSMDTQHGRVPPLPGHGGWMGRLGLQHPVLGQGGTWPLSAFINSKYGTTAKD